MRKAVVLLMIFLGCLFISDSSWGQLNRRQMKKNNKNMSRFKGRKNSFTKQKQYLSAGFSINALNYFGDIAPLSSAVSTDISFTRPGVSLWGSYRFGPRYTVEGGSDYSAADPNDDQSVFRYIRNLSFRNRIHELSGVLIVDYYENNASYISRVRLTPYAFIGIAGFYHNPEAKVNENSSLPEAGQWIKLKPLGTEGQKSDLYDNKTYSSFQFTIPFGIGVRYRLNQLLDVSFQFSIRYLFFDYIDDISKKYVDLGALDTDLARELSDRSQEATSAKSNGTRDFIRIDAFTSDETYVGVDNNTYDVFSGYGSDQNPNNIRGNVNNNDFLLYTQIRIGYIIGGSFRRAKYRYP